MKTKIQDFSGPVRTLQQTLNAILKFNKISTVFGNLGTTAKQVAMTWVCVAKR